jgi:hypothetical protein
MAWTKSSLVTLVKLAPAWVPNVLGLDEFGKEELISHQKRNDKWNGGSQ